MPPLRLPVLADNIISQLETRTFQRGQERLPRWRYWLRFFIRYVLLGLSLLYFGGLLIGVLTGRDPFPIAAQLDLVTTFFLIGILVWHFRLMLETLILGAVSIAGERESGRWELLLLTGVSAQQVVRGKWLALVKRQLPAYLWLAVFRIGAIAAFTLATHDTLTFGTVYQYFNTSIYYTLPNPLLVMLAALLIVAMTMLNLVFTASCAVMASAVSPGRVRAILSAIAARLVLTVGNAAVGVLIIQVLIDLLRRFGVMNIGWGSESNLLIIVSMTLLGLVDNGYTVASSFQSPITHYASFDYDTSLTAGLALAMLLGSLGTLGLYALLTRFNLRRSERRLVAIGVSSEPPIRVN